ncbi:hypothetical protein HC776_02740, partial [bacterium]|nr:hypothetical protein [bacterium]
MPRHLRFPVLFITVLMAYVLIYSAFFTLYPKTPADNDLPNYTVISLQAERPDLYSRDTVFADGRFTELLWASSYLYMRLLTAVRHLTSDNISALMTIMELIPSVLSVITFYGLLRAFQRDRGLTLMLAVSLSIWLLINQYEGVPSLYYFACI